MGERCLLVGRAPLSAHKQGSDLSSSVFQEIFSDCVKWTGGMRNEAGLPGVQQPIQDMMHVETPGNYSKDREKQMDQRNMKVVKSCLNCQLFGCGWTEAEMKGNYLSTLSDWGTEGDGTCQ